MIVHAQLLGTDQLERVKQLGMIPSFFVAHIYHWGEIHRENSERTRQSGSVRAEVRWSMESALLFTRTPR